MGNISHKSLQNEEGEIDPGWLLLLQPDAATSKKSDRIEEQKPMSPMSKLNLDSLYNSNLAHTAAQYFADPPTNPRRTGLVLDPNKDYSDKVFVIKEKPEKPQNEHPKSDNRDDDWLVVEDWEEKTPGGCKDGNKLSENISKWVLSLVEPSPEPGPENEGANASTSTDSTDGAVAAAAKDLDASNPYSRSVETRANAPTRAGGATAESALTLVPQQHVIPVSEADVLRKVVDPRNRAFAPLYRMASGLQNNFAPQFHFASTKQPSAGPAPERDINSLLLLDPDMKVPESSNIFDALLENVAQQLSPKHDPQHSLNSTLTQSPPGNNSPNRSVCQGRSLIVLIQKYPRALLFGLNKRSQKLSLEWRDLRNGAPEELPSLDLVRHPSILLGKCQEQLQEKKNFSVEEEAKVRESDLKKETLEAAAAAKHKSPSTSTRATGSPAPPSALPRSNVDTGSTSNPPSPQPISSKMPGYAGGGKSQQNQQAAQTVRFAKLKGGKESSATLSGLKKTSVAPILESPLAVNWTPKEGELSSHVEAMVKMGTLLFGDNERGIGSLLFGEEAVAVDKTRSSDANGTARSPQLQDRPCPNNGSALSGGNLPGSVNTKVPVAGNAKTQSGNALVSLNSPQGDRGAPNSTSGSTAAAGSSLALEKKEEKNVLVKKTGRVVKLVGAEKIPCARMWYDVDDLLGGFWLYSPRIRVTHVWCAVDWTCWGTIPNLKEIFFYNDDKIIYHYEHKE